MAALSPLARIGRIVLVLVLSAVAGVGGVWLWKTFKPRSAEQDIAFNGRVTPTSEFGNPEASIEFYEARLRTNPDRVADWVALAQLYMQQARTTGNEAAFIPKAKDALSEALRRAPNDYHALLMQGTLYNVLHQFERGEETARRALALGDGNAYPYGILVDALVELGRYPEAIRVNDSMLALRPSIASYSRASYLRELHGDTAGAVQAMRLAADAGVFGKSDRAWALYQLAALYAAQADTARARILYRGILEERPEFTLARVGLAHLDLVAGRVPAAVAALDATIRERPTEAAYALLDEAYTLQGNTAKAAEAATHTRQLLLGAEATGEVVDMELADFLADHNEDLAEAERRAEIQVRRRPDHLHANETYAWVLHKRGRSQDAVRYVEHAMRTSMKDAMLHFRAAEIYRAVGQADKAHQQYRLAEAQHVGMESPAALAQTRAALGRSR